MRFARLGCGLALAGVLSAAGRYALPISPAGVSASSSSSAKSFKACAHSAISLHQFTAGAAASEAAEAWDRAKDATSIVVLEAFIVRYKDTFYADLARARVDDLRKGTQPTPTQPSTEASANQAVGSACTVSKNLINITQERVPRAMKLGQMQRQPARTCGGRQGKHAFTLRVVAHQCAEPTMRLPGSPTNRPSVVRLHDRQVTEDP